MPALDLVLLTLVGWVDALLHQITRFDALFPCFSQGKATACSPGAGLFRSFPTGGLNVVTYRKGALLNVEDTRHRTCRHLT